MTRRVTFGQAEFDVYHDENPEIYSTLVRFARQAVAAGASHIGIGMLYERLRWYTKVEAQSSDCYKVNNNYRAFFARKIMDEHPDLVGVFETRKSRADVPSGPLVQPGLFS